MTTASGSGASAPSSDRSEQVYVQPAHSPDPGRLPAILELSDGHLTLTRTDGSVVMECPTGGVRKVVIDQASLRFHLPRERIAVSLYPAGRSRAAGTSGRLLYLSLFVNGWTNLRDRRLRGWKRALRANGITVADRNLQLVPAITVLTVGFVLLLLAAAVVQVAEWA